MAKLLNRMFEFPDGYSVLFDTSSILSNEEYFSNLLNSNERLRYRPFITSGVFQELQGIQYDKELRGELARKIFPTIKECTKGKLWYYKSNLKETCGNGLSATDENLIETSEKLKKLGPVVIVSSDSLLCETANKRGIETRRIRSNVS